MGLSLGNMFGVYTGGNKTLSTFADPMDLFGNRARRTQDKMNDYLQQSADASMKELQDSYDKIKALYQPLEDAGKKGLEQLNSQGFTPSETYKNSLAVGERDVRRQLRAMRRYDSTYGDRKMSEFYQKSAQEEVDRQYAPTLSMIQTGSGAVNAVTGAGTTFGGATDKTLANLGQGLFNSAQTYGQQRQGTYGNLSSLAGGGAAYANSLPPQQSLSSSAGGNINNVDFGTDWGNWADGTKA
jgi:hypothetical protein